MFRFRGWVTGVLVVTCAVGTASAEPRSDPPDESASRFPDEPIPLRLEGFPQRPKPILELGSPFLGTGPIDEGFEMPGGAVWQPSLLIYGTYRTALQTFDDGFGQFTEWANRLDLFANIQLTGTERVLLGVRPMDQDGRFTAYNFNPSGPDDGWQEEFNGRLTTFFFEGDLGEMFPDADPTDTRGLDWGIAVGRQPIFFQDGILINDNIDGVALVRDTLFPKGGSDLKLTFFYGWNDIDRNDNRETGNSSMFALFTEIDYPKTSLRLDAVYVDNDDTGDGFYWGLGAVQRIGHLNTTFRVLGSYALDEESPAVSSGHLFFGQVAWTPHHSHDNVYATAFWAIDQFASAARDTSTGGPLGQTGILFAAVGLGRYGAALGNRADDSVGVALGRQFFWDETRKQLIVELGGRTSVESIEPATAAIAGRYQQAIGQHMILQLDAFGSVRDGGSDGYGARIELRYKF